MYEYAEEKKTEKKLIVLKCEKHLLTTKLSMCVADGVIYSASSSVNVSDTLMRYI